MTHIPETELALYAGGDLTASESAAVAQHLDQCAECRNKAEELRHATEWLRTVAVEPDAGQVYTLRESVRSATVPTPRWRFFGFAAAVAACLALIIFGVPRFKPVQQGPSLTTVLPPIVSSSPVAPLILPSRDWQGAVRAKAHVRKKASPQLALVAKNNEDAPVIRVRTSDPNIVILWVVDSGSEQEKKQ